MEKRKGEEKRFQRSYSPNSENAKRREEAVKYAHETGKSFAEAERQFGIPHSTIYDDYKKIHGPRRRRNANTECTVPDTVAVADISTNNIQARGETVTNVSEAEGLVQNQSCNPSGSSVESTNNEQSTGDVFEDILPSCPAVDAEFMQGMLDRNSNERVTNEVEVQLIDLDIPISGLGPANNEESTSDVFVRYSYSELLNMIFEIDATFPAVDADVGATDEFMQGMLDQNSNGCVTNEVESQLIDLDIPVSDLGPLNVMSEDIAATLAIDSETTYEFIQSLFEGNSSGGVMNVDEEELIDLDAF